MKLYIGLTLSKTLHYGFNGFVKKLAQSHRKNAESRRASRPINWRAVFPLQKVIGKTTSVVLFSLPPACRRMALSYYP